MSEKNKNTSATPEEVQEAVVAAQGHTPENPGDAPRRSLFGRMKDALSKSGAVEIEDTPPPTGEEPAEEVYTMPPVQWTESAEAYNARLDAEHPGSSVSHTVTSELGSTTMTHRKIYADPGSEVLHRDGPPPQR